MIVRIHRRGVYPYLEGTIESVCPEAGVFLDRDLPDGWRWYRGHAAGDEGRCTRRDCRHLPYRHIPDLYVDPPGSLTNHPEEMWLTDGYGQMLVWNGECWTDIGKLTQAQPEIRD